MTMYGIPLAPHEIDQLPNAERVIATIEHAESEMELTCEEERIAVENELDEYKSCVTDLWGELRDLLDMLDHGNQDEIDEAVSMSKRALERNKDYR